MEKLSRITCIVAILSLCGFAACTQDVSEGGQCAEGEQTACGCPGEEEGTQVCGADGTFGPCECPDDGEENGDQNGDAGTSDEDAGTTNGDTDLDAGDLDDTGDDTGDDNDDNDDNGGGGTKSGGGDDVDCDESATPFSGGGGTPADPYRLCTPEDVANVGKGVQHLDASFIVANDIDMSEVVDDYFLIGSYGDRFTGEFDGNGYTISNLAIAKPNRSDIGMFGYVGEEGVLRDLVLEGADVEGNGFVGTLVGSHSGEIVACSVSGQVAGHLQTGGMVGQNRTGQITGSSADVQVDVVEEQAGGIAGTNTGEIVESFATGSVSSNEFVGGLAGINFGDIVDSYALGDVEGDRQVGGLVGRNRLLFLSEGTVVNSYSTGEVTGNTDVGGLIGDEEGYDQPGDSVTAGFFDRTTSGTEVSAGGEALYTVHFEDQSRFEDAEWDFDVVWTLGTTPAPDGETRPVFQWQ